MHLCFTVSCFHVHTFFQNNIFQFLVQAVSFVLLRLLIVYVVFLIFFIFY